MANTRTYVDNDDTSSAPNDYVPVTKSDGVADPEGPFRGFIMSDTGAVKLTTMRGVDRTYVTGTFSAGVPYGFSEGIQRFWSTGSGTQTIYGIV
jgi:hypothetical protein